MAILIDADMLIQAERGLFDLDRWLISQPQEEFRIAAITLAELWHGAERATGAHRMKRQEFLRRVTPVIDVVPYSAEIAILHARLWAEIEANGGMIGANDLILAATALARGDAVATLNKRHFAALPALTVITPE